MAVSTFSSSLSFDDELVVRALLAYPAFLLDEEIPELLDEGGEEAMIKKLRDDSLRCYMVAGSFLKSYSCKQEAQRNPPLCQLVRSACVHYMSCDDPWIVARPSAQSRLMGFLYAFQPHQVGEAITNDVETVSATNPNDATAHAGEPAYE
jgi:hypothetical protein